MTVRSQNWLKFGGLATVAFALGLLIAGLLNLPAGSWALQRPAGRGSVITPVSDIPSTPALKSLEELSDAFSSVAEAVRPSVVFVSAQHTETAQQAPTLPPGWNQFFPHGMRSKPQVERGTGSGFIVSSDGYILTNNHVVAGADKVTVRLIDQREFTARVIGTDPATDVAVIKIDAHDLPPLPLGNSDATHIGEWVLAIGNPLGDNLAFTVTQGIVSAKGRRLEGLGQDGQRSISDYIQTDAAINPGNSGGPLVNVRGEVIGINAAIASETGFYSGYGFAIPINLVREVMDQLVAHGKVERAQLGVLVQEATANDAAYVGLDGIRGVVIQDFGDDASPAKRAGIERGDVVISIDGKPVNRVAELQQDVAFKHPGDEVAVEVARRGGVRKVIKVRLTASDSTSGTKLAQNGSGNGDNAPAARNAIAPLGITVQTLTSDLADQYQLKDQVQGAVVTDVDPNGPSAQYLADEASGGPDIITAVEGHPVKGDADLRKALKAAGPGTIVTLDVYNARTDSRRLTRIKLAGGSTGS
ncbi:MAG TPA: trypsin-like peptidase domain-containing protein [Gemmatimonadales bacterium]|nr:trypsin-like peptidase domain-containing protein [Gemmatimonadales bacterium]